MLNGMITNFTPHTHPFTHTCYTCTHAHYTCTHTHVHIAHLHTCTHCTPTHMYIHHTPHALTHIHSGSGSSDAGASPLTMGQSHNEATEAPTGRGCGRGCVAYLCLSPWENENPLPGTV